MRSAVVARTGMLWGLLALVSGVRADEQKVELKDVPQAVLDAVKAKFPGAELKGAGKETEDGKTLYEVTLKDKGQNVDATLTPEGLIKEIEREITPRDLPKPVAAALEAKYPKAAIKKAEVIVEIEAGKETKSYEVVLTTEDKKSVEVKLSPEGKVLKTEEGSGD
jgi:uncharacterized membrane protein YkoI